MAMQLKKCEKCGTYTLRDSCPKCGSPTKTAHYKFIKIKTEKSREKCQLDLV
ncbi:ribosome biogenesis protein [Candidatus Pacearchaeota archaeon]|nr:MAG: ribosome biogenesis protein [Candidatus Pacearchaeota archaeon]